MSRRVKGAGRAVGGVRVAALWLVAGAAAAAPIQDSPDSEAIRLALDKPRLVYCDDLSCYYRPPRRFDVRAVDCRPGEAAQTVVCAYERAPAARVRPLPPGAAPEPDRRVWVPARSELTRLGEEWVVLSDADS